VPTSRLAVLIPAHDESAMISGSVASVLAEDYPAELFDVWVVADNCCDDTAERAAAAGAQVLVRVDDTRRGKGWALRCGMEHLLALEQSPDAVVVIDADATVRSGFLAALEACLRAGAQVIQATDIVRAVPGNRRSELESIVIGMRNTVRLTGREVLGIPAVLCGNGMLFSADVLRRHAWGSSSIVEDAEYGIRLRLAGFRPVFCREAMVMAMATGSDSGAYTQALRWDGGRMFLAREWLSPVLRAMLRGRLDLIDLAVDLVSPSLVLLGLGVAAGDAAALTGVALGWVEPIAALAWVAATVFLSAYLALAPALTESGPGAHLAILRQAPRFALLKLRTYAGLLAGRGGGGWVRTER
jgi:glycosyltransferase involved in cell wall biosynthesis